MTIPDWQTSKAGARVRVALWLHSEVGAGGTFSKADLRNAFPGVEQIDRRMRDLRPEGWIITTYQEDRSLSADELRLVREGGAVWERGYRSQQSSAITAKERQATMRADDFACVFCGIGGGEPYPDDQLRTARLLVIRRSGEDSPVPKLLTVCNRCVAGGIEAGSDDLLAEIGELTKEQRDRFAAWVQRGSRPRTREEQLWGRYRRLAAAERAVIERHLRT